MRSRTFFASVSAVEIALGLILLNGAVQFALSGQPEIALALTLKGTGFMIVAFLSSGDLWPSFWRRAPSALPVN
jgi:hypothetical protein